MLDWSMYSNIEIDQQAAVLSQGAASNHTGGARRG